MPLDPFATNVNLNDFQDESLTGVAAVLLFEFQEATPKACPMITRVIIGQSADQVKNFSTNNPELPLPQFSGSCLAGNANIIHLDASGQEASRASRFTFVSQTDQSVKPPVATEISLAHNPDGLPAPVEKAYFAGLSTCFGSLTKEAAQLFRLFAELQLTLEKFDDL